MFFGGLSRVCLVSPYWWEIRIASNRIPHLHAAGFEPAKHEAIRLKRIPFDQTRVCVHSALGGARTLDLQLIRLPLYQLSYKSIRISF